MSNSYFRFKQFTVWQQQCAMKVCTDACLFGAWVAHILQTQFSSFNYILDVGAGTGLLSLMIAQKNSSVVINAIEIDKAACEEAARNVNLSPWKNTIRIIPVAAQQYKPENLKYDFIVCNPPFLDNQTHLQGKHEQRNKALHTVSLQFAELIEVCKYLLKEEAAFAVLLPFNKSHYFQQLAQEAGFYLYMKTNICTQLGQPFFRSMLWFLTTPAPPCYDNVITIQKKPNQYSREFIGLLKDYYLYL
jgi:tRNA1Val (adenine37-N6)-methyltransferase